MTSAAKALTDYALRDLHLNKVEIRAAEQNKKAGASQNDWESVQEGTIRQAEWLYDHYVDHAFYGILAIEWRLDQYSKATCCKLKW